MGKTTHRGMEWERISMWTSTVCAVCAAYEHSVQWRFKHCLNEMLMIDADSGCWCHLDWQGNLQKPEVLQYITTICYSSFLESVLRVIPTTFLGCGRHAIHSATLRTFGTGQGSPIGASPATRDASTCLSQRWMWCLVRIQSACVDGGKPEKQLKTL